MKKTSIQNALKAKRTKLFGLFGEKTLLAVFAGLSLAFALFYTFGDNTSYANSNNNQATAKSSAESQFFVNNQSNAPESAASVSDVVAKAQAFKATLSAAQITTLQQTYTTTLARRWSNLPCGSSCRNGIQFSSLTSAQLAAALAVVQAATGTAANEGYDEFQQIRAADDYLNQNGGGSGYGGGIYFIAFLNEPSTSGAWMLQFGGHHYAANIAYNNGHVVGATPEFRGVEPISFTSNGVTYAPLSQERDALAAMLASLSSSQLATAKLSQTFSDVTMSPGESNGGSGTFPTTKVGVPVSSLSDTQKALVVAAIRPYTSDLDDTVAANLLSIYSGELNNTYISFTGSGTSGDASSFLNTNTNYVRIDGTSVWVEFIVQTGAVFRSSIHYHTVYRDHTRDYGADLSLTAPLDTTGATPTPTATPTITPSPTATPVVTPSPTATPTTTPTPSTSRRSFDFDGDGKSDVAVYRPSSGIWYLQQSTAGFSGIQFGLSTDKLVPADYDGDGKTDIAVYRDGTWYLQRSASGFTAVSFGLATDTPAPADYDGDGKADLAVYRASTGTWYILNLATSQFASVQFGIAEDKPVVGDYDADGKADQAVYRPSNGTWYLNRSTQGFAAIQFGLSTDKPTVGDYDGDGKADETVYRAETGTWYLLKSTQGFAAIQFGLSTDVPTPADYDGDGKTDVAVYRPSSGTWYYQASTAGFAAAQFGVSTDTPVSSVYVR